MGNIYQTQNTRKYHARIYVGGSWTKVSRNFPWIIKIIINYKSLTSKLVKVKGEFIINLEIKCFSNNPLRTSHCLFSIICFLSSFFKKIYKFIERIECERKTFSFYAWIFYCFPYIHTHTQHTDMLYQLVNKTLEARLFYLLLHQFAQLFMNLSIRYCAAMMMMMMKWALLLFYFIFCCLGMKNKFLTIFLTCQWLLTLLLSLFVYVRGDLVKYALAICAVCGFYRENIWECSHTYFLKIFKQRVGDKKGFFFLCVKMLIIHR